MCACHMNITNTEALSILSHFLKVYFFCWHCLLCPAFLQTHNHKKANIHTYRFYFASQCFPRKINTNPLILVFSEETIFR